MISNEKEFWTVGFSQWGRWQVRKASVDTPDKYTLVEDLGPELTAAYLEADGDFVYIAGQEHLSLITAGVPWLFVITTSGKLYVKRVAEPLENAILLDIDVLQASTVRGWKSDKYGVDSGLLVVYRKQNGVYLRPYYKIADTYTWDVIQTLSSSHVNHIEIKRMNDYRLGILLDNQLLLSDRYYIGSTSKTEFMNGDFDIEFEVCSFMAEDGEHDDLVIEAVDLIDHIEFHVRANYPFYSLDPRWPDLQLTTSVTEGQGIDHWWIEDGLLKIRMKLPITSPLAYMSFKIRAINRVRFERTPQSRPICPEINIIYQAPPIPYSETFNPSLSFNVSLVMKERRNLRGYTTEHFEPTLAFNATVNMQEVQRLSNRFEEQFDSELQITVSPIVMQLVGDKPI